MNITPIHARSRRRRSHDLEEATYTFYFGYIASSLALGFIVGLSILFLSYLYNSLWEFSTSLLDLSPYFTIPIVTFGILSAYLIVKYVTRTKTTGCGTHGVIETYHHLGGNIPLRDSLGKTMASAATIGFGGSAGLEGPSLFLGGGLASIIGQKIGFRAENLRVFFLCGAASGISAIFKAPLTGILFALEIPYKHDLAKEAFIPASLASITSYLTIVLTTGTEELFPLIPSMIIPSPRDILLMVFEGFVAAGLAMAFIQTYRLAEKARLRSSSGSVLAVFGGSIVGVIGLFFPQVLGIGYETILRSADGNLYEKSAFLLLSLLMLKIVATSITLNFGGSGGLFIPSIFVGGLLGVLFTQALSLGPNELVVVASMAALIAAVNKTLLTSIAFVAETVGPSSIIPALIAACISYFLTGKRSFYENQPVTRRVEEEKALDRLYSMLDKRDLDLLQTVQANEVMTPNPVMINEDISISEAFEAMKEHKYRVYPVVDDENRLIGYVEVEDLLSLPYEEWSLPINHVNIHNPIVALEDENLKEIVEEMVRRERDHAYVVANLETRKLIGVIAGMDAVGKLLEILKKR